MSDITKRQSLEAYNLIRDYCRQQTGNCTDCLFQMDDSENDDVCACLFEYEGSANEWRGLDLD